MMTPGSIPGILEVLKELHEGSDRAAAVVGGALIEEILSRMLRDFLRGDKKELDEMFGISSPLGTFSAKIKAGYFLGRYDSVIRKDLDYVRKIRNEFAHELSATFEAQKVRSLCFNLELVERYSCDMQSDLQEPLSKPLPENRLQWPFWIALHDRDKALLDPRERFLGELQALLWALNGVVGQRVPIGSFG